MKSKAFILWAGLATCLTAPFVAGFLTHFLEFRLINLAELERMYLEDGKSLEIVRNYHFSDSAFVIALFLTPLLLLSHVGLASLLTIRHLAFRWVAAVALLAIPSFFGFRMILDATSEQQSGGIEWGAILISGPLIFTTILLIREALAGRDGEKNNA